MTFMVKLTEEDRSKDDKAVTAYCGGVFITLAVAWASFALSSPWPAIAWFFVVGAFLVWLSRREAKP